MTLVVLVILVKPRHMTSWPDSSGGPVSKGSHRVIATASYTLNPVTTVTMDLIVALPPTLDGNISLVVLLKLKKMLHNVPCVGQSELDLLRL
jgi:hypothetical protein